MLSKLKLKNIPHAHPHNINSLRPGIESPFQKNKKNKTIRIQMYKDVYSQYHATSGSCIDRLNWELKTFDINCYIHTKYSI